MNICREGSCNGFQLKLAIFLFFFFASKYIGNAEVTKEGAALSFLILEKKKEAKL